MKNKLIVIYSPLCEANGSFVENIYEWVKSSDSDVDIEVYSFDTAPEIYRELQPVHENCFIDVLLNGRRIDTVPLHKERILKALHISEKITLIKDEAPSNSEKDYSEGDIRAELFHGNIRFIPITAENFMKEMQMCLRNYPRGNPPVAHHNKCIEIKRQVFTEIWEYEAIAGIYAELRGEVIGLIEVLPREIVKKYGFMTGTQGNDDEVMTITCYEVANKVPRTFMLDELMYHLVKIKGNFTRKRLEGIGVLGCIDGFNPYWVYEKYGFKRTEKLGENTFVLETSV